jgi:hypothetical protein
MSGFAIVVIIIIFIGTILCTSRFFYIFDLKTLAKKLTSSLQIDVLNLDFSFEQMVYFIALPSNIPSIKNAKIEDLIIEHDYTSLFFPKLAGIKIRIHSDPEKRILAYLPIKGFRLPTLDRMLEQGKINDSTYLKISTFKLIHPSTLKDISDEVFKQLQLGRYS